MSMSVTVERGLCIGAGNCVRLAPAVFELDAEEISVVIDGSAGDDATLELAAASCPAGAIYVEPASGGG